jgi:hypothetical protein
VRNGQQVSVLSLSAVNHKLRIDHRTLLKIIC